MKPLSSDAFFISTTLVGDGVGEPGELEGEPRLAGPRRAAPRQAAPHRVTPRRATPRHGSSNEEDVGVCVTVEEIVLRKKEKFDGNWRKEKP